MKASAILESHRDSVVARARAYPTVLAIQDTTDLDFTTRPCTQGLGFINQTKQQGIKVHTCFAVSGDGEPLGVLHQHCWNRPQRSGKREKRHKTPIEQKESYRWLQTLTAAEKGLEGSKRIIHIGDREADIFELFARPRSGNSELLIRAEHNRKVNSELGYLLPTLERAPVLGSMSVELERNPKRPKRKAQLQMRAIQVRVEVPQNHPKPHNLKPMSLNAILVEEIGFPADGSQLIRWMLLSTLPVDGFEQVCDYVRWYTYRWLIERFHFTLKSGCGIEELQLQSVERLLKALATYSIVAWRLMWLVYRSRLTPEDSCEPMLERKEWRLLRRKFVPKSRSKKPPTLREAIRWIARLGGFLARKGDGEPGVKTLWRGFTKLQNLLEGVQLATKT